ncbi:hypothetical protein D3C72_2433820 [compost metagenome]
MGSSGSLEMEVTVKGYCSSPSPVKTPISELFFGESMFSIAALVVNRASPGRKSIFPAAVSFTMVITMLE